jgi:aldose 1-epimerase
MKILILALALALMTFTHQSQSSEVSKQPYGKMPDGTPVDIYTLKDGKIEIRITNYGGIVQTLKVPDRNGNVADVVLGFDTLDEYVKTGNTPHFGGIIGRYANRNAHGSFKLNGKTYQIPKNDGDNALHGGPIGFDKVVWQAKQIPNGIELTHVSKDGDQGFPGTLIAVVRYTLVGNQLKIEYSATTDADTVVNLTNHSYFNLKGQGNGDILGHEVKLEASRFTPVEATLIPTGELAPVEGTPFDFRKSTVVGSRINDNNEQLKLARGYDQNWVLDNKGKFAEAAEAYEPTTGRVLQVMTDQPGTQFYTGNFLDGTITGKDGRVYKYRYGLALETQHFPDSPNHPQFPSTELKPGQHYHTVTVLKFSTR